jgi:hypothetical protein
MQTKPAHLSQCAGLLRAVHPMSSLDCLSKPNLFLLPNQTWASCSMWCSVSTGNMHYPSLLCAAYLNQTCFSFQTKPEPRAQCGVCPQAESIPPLGCLSKPNQLFSFQTKPEPHAQCALCPQAKSIPPMGCLSLAKSNLSLVLNVQFVPRQDPSPLWGCLSKPNQLLFPNQTWASCSMSSVSPGRIHPSSGLPSFCSARYRWRPSPPHTNVAVTMYPHRGKLCAKWAAEKEGCLYIIQPGAEIDKTAWCTFPTRNYPLLK